MSSIFSSITLKKPKKSKFNLSHEVKLSCDIGQLVPTMCLEAMPGDRFKLRTESLVKFAPLVAPIMHRVNVKHYFFKVPMRLLWDDFEDFITGGPDGKAAPAFPKIHFSGSDFNDAAVKNLFSNGSLADYLGMPTLGKDYPYQGIADNYVSALPFRAYQLVFNEYFRDQNLQPEVDIDKGSGDYFFHNGSQPSSYKQQLIDLMTLRFKGWEKDYLTSALPFAQRGDAVSLPIKGSTVDINFNSALSSHGSKVVDPGTDNWSTLSISPTNPTVMANKPANHATDAEVQIDNSDTLEGSVKEASADINALRLATRAQRWLEIAARTGARYIEQIFGHFGVKSSDARLQRPEYLGGSSAPVMIGEVLQTSASDSVSPQANMAGMAQSASSNYIFRTFCEEHCFIIGVMCILPRTAYFQGMPRKFLKFNKFDYFWPEFQYLGEQKISSAEVNWDYNVNTDVQLDDEFGYQRRYAEYMYEASSVHGDFRDMSAGGLAMWHMARYFTPSTRVLLNGSFVSTEPALASNNRIFAYEGTDVNHLYVQLYHSFQAELQQLQNKFERHYP